MKFLRTLLLTGILLTGICGRVPACSSSDQEDSIKTVKTDTYTATTSGISYKYIETFLDDAHLPRSLYYNIRFAEVLGVTASDVISGSLSVEVFDKGKAVTLPRKPEWYCARTFKEGEQVNILLSIPLNPIVKAKGKYRYKLSLVTASDKKIIAMEGSTQ